MRYREMKLGRAKKHMRRMIDLLSSIAVLLYMTGCGSGTQNISPPPQTSQQGPQTYFAPYVYNTTNGGANSLLPGANIYEIDHFWNSFSQSTFQLSSNQKGPQPINTGKTNTGQRGLLALEITTNYIPSGNNYVATTSNLPKVGSFALELANRAGGLIQLIGQPVAPLVTATQCPNLKTAQTYQFITIPAGMINSNINGLLAPFWDPAKNTAYGSVDITSDGTNVTFDKIHQYTLPSAGGTGTPAQPSSSPKTGLCGPTALGNTISVPGQLITKEPGIGNNTPSPQATIGIGPTGLLVEDNGVNTSNQYENVLGDGTGAVGLPKPSNALDTNALRGAQYLGFVYGAGVFTHNNQPTNGWSSHLVSFGFSSLPSSCPNVAASTPLYGGDFTNDDPSTSSGGFGNCDLVIDLGKQDSSNNGLFPAATVWLGAGYAANPAGKAPFQAVAIAGQLDNKYVIFLLGADSTQPWVIYLMQSN